MHPWIEKMVRHVRTTPPSCLGGFRVTPAHPEPWNDWIAWDLACSCGATEGKLLGHPLKDCNPEYDGPALFVSPLAFWCSSCGKTTEIIDTKQHGYNSEIGKPDARATTPTTVAPASGRSCRAPVAGGRSSRSRCSVLTRTST